VITEYPLATPNAWPSGIAISGNDVWFAEAAANKLGWLDTNTGDAYEFTIPTSNSIPQDVVMASSGNPWLTETQGNKIGVFRASTIQDLLEFPVRTDNSEPYGIALARDLAVWFTERAGNKLGRYTGSGAFPQEFSLPTPNSQPTGIVVDDTGCAWYTAPPANRIGRLCLLSAYLPLIVR
jgi:virginiamycin B lyase